METQRRTCALTRQNLWKILYHKMMLFYTERRWFTARMSTWLWLIHSQVSCRHHVIWVLRFESLPWTFVNRIVLRFQPVGWTKYDVWRCDLKVVGISLDCWFFCLTFRAIFGSYSQVLCNDGPKRKTHTEAGRYRNKIVCLNADNQSPSNKKASEGKKTKDRNRKWA